MKTGGQVGKSQHLPLCLWTQRAGRNGAGHDGYTQNGYPDTLFGYFQVPDQSYGTQSRPPVALGASHREGARERARKSLRQIVARGGGGRRVESGEWRESGRI